MEKDTFESDLERLEEIVASLEEGDLALDKALARFEEGVRLARACRERLAAAEGKIETLLETGETRSLSP